MVRFASIVALSCALSFCTTSDATTYIWNFTGTPGNGVEGDWSYGPDWGGTAPNTAGTAEFDFTHYGNAALVNVDSTVSINALTLVGSGALRINGTSIAPLTVTGGGGITVGANQTLNGNGYINAGSGGFTVNGTLGGPLDLTGNVASNSGTFFGPLTVHGGGYLDGGSFYPGDTYSGGIVRGGVGSMHFTEDVYLDAMGNGAGTFYFDLGKAGVGGTDYDQIKVDGNLEVSWSGDNGTVNITTQPGFASNSGLNTYTLMQGATVSNLGSGYPFDPGTIPFITSHLTYGNITVGSNAVTIAFARTTGLAFSWSGGGGSANHNNNWWNPANWSGAGGYLAPIAGDSATVTLVPGTPTVIDVGTTCTTSSSTTTFTGLSNPAVGSLSLAGTGVLTINGGTSTSGGLTVTGSGGITVGANQTLNGNGYINAGSGGFTVNGGTVGGPLDLTGNVTSNSGTFFGPLTVHGGGYLDGGSFYPGDTYSGGIVRGGAGSMHFTGDVYLDAMGSGAGTFYFDLGKAGVGGTDYDQIKVDGNLEVSWSGDNGTVNIAARPGFASNSGTNTYTLMQGSTVSNLGSGYPFDPGTIPSVTGHLTYGDITVGSTAVTIAFTRTTGLGFSWSGGGGSANYNNNWWNPANWNGAGGYLAPIAGDSATITLVPGTPTVIDVGTTCTTSSSATTFTGLSNPAVGSLSLAGTGVLTINGGTGTSGGLTVTGSGGITVGANQTLNGNGYINAGSGGFTVNGGVLGGPLNLTGNVTSNGGHVTPGGATTMNVHGGLTLDSASTLNYKLASPGGGNDRIDVTGNVSLDGTLSVTALEGFGVGTYQLMTVGSASGRILNSNVHITGFTLPDTTTDGFGFTEAYAATVYTPASNNVVNLRVGVIGDVICAGGFTRTTAAADIDAINANLTATTGVYNALCDLNGDGAVTRADVTYMLTYILHTHSGDATLDQHVNIDDFSVLLAHWGSSSGTWAGGDVTGDRVVNIDDFSVLLSNWGAGPIGFGFASMQTPEPTTLVLLGLGGLALLRRSRMA